MQPASLSRHWNFHYRLSTLFGVTAVVAIATWSWFVGRPLWHTHRLVEAIKLDRPEQLIEALTALERMENFDRTVFTLLPMTEEGNSRARARAIVVLGAIRRQPTLVIPRLKSHLLEVNESVASAAAFALGCFASDDADARAILISRMRQHDRTGRIAFDALRNLPDEGDAKPSALFWMFLSMRYRGMSEPLPKDGSAATMADYALRRIVNAD